MSIKINIEDPKGCRLAKLMKAISEYMAESGNGKIGVNMNVTWHKKKKDDEDAD